MDKLVDREPPLLYENKTKFYENSNKNMDEPEASLIQMTNWACESTR